MLLMSAIPLFFLIFLFPLVPESPRYLLVKGDTEGALRVIRDAAICNNRGIPPFKKLAPIHHAPPTAVHPAVEETTPPASVAPPTVIGAESGSQASAEKRANADRSNSASSTEGNNAVRRGQLGELLKPAIWKTTVLLWVVWFGCTQVYYGIILLITKMFSLENSGTRCPSYHTEESAELASCVDGHINLTHDEFSDILVTSFGELPGLLLTAVIINNIGRKKTLSVELLLTGLCAVLVMPCTSRAFETTMLFGIRMFVSGAFQAAYVYTPEVYPTALRSTGLGVCSSVARVSGMITPYVAQVLAEFSAILALAVYVVICFAAALAAYCLPVETLGIDMSDTLHQYHEKKVSQKQPGGKKGTSVTGGGD
eukprot:Rmarinus@m.2384